MDPGIWRHLLDGLDRTLFHEGGRGELRSIVPPQRTGLRHYVDKRRDEIELRSDVRQSLRARFLQTESLAEQESGVDLASGQMRRWQSSRECDRKDSAGAGAFAIAG